jgi:hypothetical protein
MLKRVGSFKKKQKIKMFPNILKAHPIENLSGCLCQQVYEGEWEAKSEAQIIRR